jgi:hypothetical protein
MFTDRPPGAEAVKKPVEVGGPMTMTPGTGVTPTFPLAKPLEGFTMACPERERFVPPTTVPPLWEPAETPMTGLPLNWA